MGLLSCLLSLSQARSDAISSSLQALFWNTWLLGPGPVTMLEMHDMERKAEAVTPRSPVSTPLSHSIEVLYRSD